MIGARVERHPHGASLSPDQGTVKFCESWWAAGTRVRDDEVAPKGWRSNEGSTARSAENLKLTTRAPFVGAMRRRTIDTDLNGSVLDLDMLYLV